MSKKKLNIVSKLILKVIASYDQTRFRNENKLLLTMNGSSFLNTIMSNLIIILNVIYSIAFFT